MGLTESDIVAVSWRQAYGHAEVLRCSVLQYSTHILGIQVSPSDRASPVHAVQRSFVILTTFVTRTRDLKHGASWYHGTSNFS